VIGSAAYGAKKAIETQDATAIGAVVAGAGVGAGASAVVGGMGLAVAGTAVGVTMAPVAAVGAVVGLAGYGVSKLFGRKKSHKSHRAKSWRKKR
jgi:integral membrane sensor domain MASE1